MGRDPGGDSSSSGWDALGMMRGGGRGSRVLQWVAGEEEDAVHCRAGGGCWCGLALVWVSGAGEVTAETEGEEEPESEAGLRGGRVPACAAAAVAAVG